MPKALRHDTVMTALVSSMATVLWYMMMCLCLSLGNAIFSTPHLWGPRPAMSSNSTCDDWVEWIPPVSDPAVVMQVVSKGYINVERNFIRLMEENSQFTRHHLFLMCTDIESVQFFAGSMGIRCVPLEEMDLSTREEIWMLRVRVVSCLVEADQDVIMSDADALWLQDPMNYFTLPGVVDSNIVASRGSFPVHLGREWGSTICMGFILFRASSNDSMRTFLDVMYNHTISTMNDQVSINTVAHDLGIAWDKEGSDMRYNASTSMGVGTIESLVGNNGRPFKITLLPHTSFTRKCDATPISSETVVAHCFVWGGGARSRTAWMRNMNLWRVGP